MENDQMQNAGMPPENPGLLSTPAEGKEAKGGFSEMGEKFIQHVYEKIKPEDKESLDRIVVAGQKVMFSKETHQYMLDALEGEGEIADKLGMGIVQLMVLLYDQSKGSMPPQLITPAGSILLVKAAEYIERTGGEMDTAIFGDALKLMVIGLHRQMSSKAGGQEGAEQPGQPAEPQATEPQQPQGLINAAGA